MRLTDNRRRGCHAGGGRLIAADYPEPGTDLTFPLTPEVTITTEVTGTVPTLLISALSARLAFHPVDPTSVTRADLAQAGQLHEAVQLYFDTCARYLAARETFGDWPG